MFEFWFQIPSNTCQRLLYDAHISTDFTCTVFTALLLQPFLEPQMYCVYELGFSYLSISIFNPHSLKAIWEMRDWPPIHRIAQGSFSYGLRGHTQTSWGGGSHKTTAKHVTMLLEWIIKIIIYTLHIWITIEDHTLEFKMQNLYLVNLRCFFRGGGGEGILPKKTTWGGWGINWLCTWLVYVP